MLARPLAIAPPTPGDQAACPEKEGIVGSALPQRKATILCVDDEPDALAVLGWFLAAEGLEVVTASNGAEALLRVTEHLPDVVITDYLMPRMNGLELCGRLRGGEKTRRIPIIIYTALHLPADSWLYDRTLLKPAELDVFATEIRSLLARNH